MNDNITLCCLVPGGRAVVTGVNGRAEECRRLRGLGMTNGTQVECVLKRNGIRAFLIKGTVIALRDSDSAKVRACPDLCIAEKTGGDRRYGRE